MTPIIAFGELLWDVFPDGSRRVGGAPLNFAAHCVRLGRPAALVSAVGADEPGEALRAEVRRLGVSDEFVATVPDEPTGFVTVTLDSAGVPTYRIEDAVAWDAIPWTAELVGLASAAAAVYHGTLAMWSADNRATLDRLKASAPSARCVADLNFRDPRPSPAVLESALRGADWVKVTAEEFAQLSRHFGYSPEELVLWHHRMTPGDDRAWLVTHGADGAEVRTWRESHRVPGIPVTVTNTVGAGDAFFAAAVCRRLAGDDWLAALTSANQYAADVVSGLRP